MHMGNLHQELSLQVCAAATPLRLTRSHVVVTFSHHPIEPRMGREPIWTYRIERILSLLHHKTQNPSSACPIVCKQTVLEGNRAHAPPGPCRRPLWRRQPGRRGSPGRPGGSPAARQAAPARSARPRWGAAAACAAPTSPAPLPAAPSTAPRHEVATWIGCDGIGMSSVHCSSMIARERACKVRM